MVNETIDFVFLAFAIKLMFQSCRMKHAKRLMSMVLIVSKLECFALDFSKEVLTLARAIPVAD
jgi:hypothetical protein